MKKILKRAAAVLLALTLCAALAACSGGGASGGKDGGADYGSYAVGEGVLTLKTVSADPLLDGKFSGYDEADGWVLLVFEPGGGRITFGDISDFAQCITVDGCTFENMSGTLGEAAALSDLSNTAIAEGAGVYYLFDAPADFAFTAEALHIDAPAAK